MNLIFARIRTAFRECMDALTNCAIFFATCGRAGAPLLPKSRPGEGYIDTAVKILIAVVLGALLLAGLYTLFNDVVMPTVTQKIREMFNYSGTVI